MMRSAIAILCLAVGSVVGLVVSQPLVGQPPITAPVPKDLTSYRDIVKAVLPAVVSIEVKPKAVVRTKQQTQRQQPGFDDSQIPEEFRKFFDQFKNQPFEMPQETPRHAFGSGFLVDPHGVVLTNHHVVSGADEVIVQLQDGRKFTSKAIKSDPKTDLAIVRLDSKTTFPYLELGDSDAMAIGDRVLAVGAPFGLTGTVTHGIVSGKGRNLQMNMYEDFIQTDAPINPGNSGGPLISLDGKVIGINSAIKSRTGGFQGVGMAISSNLAKDVMQQLEKNGVVHRGYLGVQISPLQPDVAARLGVPNHGGVVVSNVFDNTPAAKAGLKAGDVITAVAGKPIQDGRQLQRQVAELPVGKAADFSVVRDGKVQTIPVTIGEQPASFGVAGEQPSTPNSEPEHKTVSSFGLKLADMTPQLAKQFGFKEKLAGALIMDVEENSVAADAGLSQGALIVKVDKQEVKSAEEAQKALEKASLQKGVLLQVRTAKGGVQYVLLQANTNKSNG
jgi:serine protease Do